MARPSFGARCPSCGAPAVIPRRDAERAIDLVGPDATYTWMCRCGQMATAAIVRTNKPPKKLKGGSRPRMTALGKRLRRRWASGVGEVCANCGRKADYARVFIEGHHVVRKALIKARAKEERWTEEELDRRLWDERNRLDLCGDCHLRDHHNGKKLPWSLVQAKAPKAIQFAREIGLLRRASKDYASAK